jgi:hypothetical protein
MTELFLAKGFLKSIGRYTMYTYHRGLSSGLLKFKKIFKNLILIKIHLWEPSENNADKFQ